jgi:hypothetical protein
MPLQPPQPTPKHPNALQAINSASIALKLYRKDGRIPDLAGTVNINQLILELDHAYKDLLECQERTVLHQLTDGRYLQVDN